ERALCSKEQQAEPSPPSAVPRQRRPSSQLREQVLQDAAATHGTETCSAGQRWSCPVGGQVPWLRTPPACSGWEMEEQPSLS
ncbi:hypothetical protein N339_02363, partial [Pterocles gutturalis]